ncbi:FtsX-like permease family protein [Sunxiuqinia sp. A32]|uniref:FtsX-like permease family protein n=1 Tax=Sunxiuqinia sp. A32 TaxID=3461496 RepID=UPI004045C4E4
MRTNFIIAFRNLYRSQISGILGILGFAIGFAVCLVIGAYIYGELNVDHHQKNYRNIFRLVDSTTDNCEIDYRLHDILKEKYASIKQAVPVEIQPDLNADTYTDEHSYYIQGLIATTNDFFDIFPIQVLKCMDTENPFADINSSILTKSAAQKIFGNVNPLGQSLKVSHMQTTVSAIVADFDAGSSFTGQIFLNSANENFRLNSNWAKGEIFNTTNHFVLLEENTQIDQLTTELNRSIGNYSKQISTIKLQALTNIYLNTTIRDKSRHGSKSLIITISVIGILILLLSIINYINFAIALQLKKLNLIGIKKTNGAGIWNIVFYFITDVFVWVILSLSLSILIVYVSLPLFNRLFQQQLQVELFYSFPMIVGGAIFLLLIVVVSVVPVLLLLSRFSIQDFLKNNLRNNKKRNSSNFLSVFQLSVSIVLLIGLIVTVNQIAHMKHQNLGFDDQLLLHVAIPYKALNEQSFKNELLKHPSIEKVSLSAGIPGKISNKMNNPAWPYTLNFIDIDNDFIETMGITLLDGRLLTPNDKDNCIVNQATLNALEYTDYQNKKVNGMNIVGVVHDFNFASLHQKIQPIIMKIGEGRDVSIRIANGEIAPAIEYIRNTWGKMTSNTPLQYQFYDSWFDSLYKKEEQLGNAITILALVAIAITCLGLLSQVIQIASQKTKEIGIRKVNGAKISEVMTMLNKDFVKWVAIAFIIATPIAYLAMNKWLENFAYKTTLSWWIFALAGLLALGIALLTVSWQSWKAATRNPVEALRYE